ncbi:MAG: hypothetical protein IPP40_14425 [bacterium]|nr:hypothetical protein [bacterium]
MFRFVPLVLGVMLLIGCGKEEVKKAQTTAPPQEMQKRDPASFVDANFLGKQAVKRDEVRQVLDSLRGASVIDRKSIAVLINHRKGELMALKKNLRGSTQLTETERDSLIAPLEAESIELTHDLIAVAK